MLKSSVHTAAKLKQGMILGKSHSKYSSALIFQYNNNKSLGKNIKPAARNYFKFRFSNKFCLQTLQRQPFNQFLTNILGEKKVNLQWFNKFNHILVKYERVKRELPLTKEVYRGHERPNSKSCTKQGILKTLEFQTNQ